MLSQTSRVEEFVYRGARFSEFGMRNVYAIDYQGCGLDGISTEAIGRGWAVSWRSRANWYWYFVLVSLVANFIGYWLLGALLGIVLTLIVTLF